MARWRANLPASKQALENEIDGVALFITKLHGLRGVKPNNWVNGNIKYNEARLSFLIEEYHNRYGV